MHCLGMIMVMSRDEQVSTRTRNYVDLDELPPVVGSNEDDDEYEPSLAPTPTNGNRQRTTRR